MAADLFRDLKKEVLEITDRNPLLTPDNAFLVWFLRAFVLDAEDTAVESLTGGCRDKGVDAVYTDHDARIVFLHQGKYHQGPKPPAEKRSDVIALADLGRAIMLESNSTFRTIIQDCDETAKKALEEARSHVQRRGYRLSVQFVTTGKVSPTHKAEGEQRLEDWRTASFEIFARTDLLRLLQDYIEGAAPPTPTIQLPIHGKEAFSRHDTTTGITSWIFSVLGSDIAALYKSVGVRLFARNIRGFLGITDINRGMQATIEDEPQLFWYFNNGITIVCDEARKIERRGADTLRITNAQIINGQQTTRCLALNPRNDAEVLVKLVEIPRDSQESHAKYSHVVSEIVSATNWQNAITASDLKANDYEQVRLEREFRKINYQYLRKKMSKSEARRNSRNRYRFFIKKEDIARSVGACILDPYEVRLGKDRIFENDVYDKIFDGKPASEYLAHYWLDRVVKYWCRNDSRRGYARWIALNFLWTHLGQYMRRPEFREKFRYAAERWNKYAHQIKPLDQAVNDIFTVILRYYRNNRRHDGKVMDESSFFKHKNLHRELQSFWAKQPRKQRQLFTHRLDTFRERIHTVELD